MVMIIVMLSIAVVGGGILKAIIDGIGNSMDRAVDQRSEDFRAAPADSNAAERAERIAALKQQGDARSIAELEVLTRDPNRTVRTLAEAALSDLGVRR